MISIVDYLFEAEKKEVAEPYKMKNVGSGYGKWFGTVAAGLSGTVAGHYIGKNAPNNPEAPADTKKPFHRAGIIADEQMNAKRMLKGAGIGAVGGLAAGGLAALHPDVREAIQDDPKKIALLAALATGIGIGGGTMVGGYKAAKKLGYGKVGKAFGTLTPLTGIAKPKAQKDKESKTK